MAYLVLRVFAVSCPAASGVTLTALSVYSIRFRSLTGVSRKRIMTGSTPLSCDLRVSPGFDA